MSNRFRVKFRDNSTQYVETFEQARKLAMQNKEIFEIRFVIIETDEVISLLRFQDTSIFAEADMLEIGYMELI